LPDTAGEVRSASFDGLVAAPPEDAEDAGAFEPVAALDEQPVGATATRTLPARRVMRCRALM
jgi:hypothetical protein